jgi:hypothetical protein
MGSANQILGIIRLIPLLFAKCGDEWRHLRFTTGFTRLMTVSSCDLDSVTRLHGSSEN